MQNLVCVVTQRDRKAPLAQMAIQVGGKHRIILNSQNTDGHMGSRGELHGGADL